MPAPIKHLVVLMMENRSFDHMFGWMASPDYPIDGLTGSEKNPDSSEVEVAVSADADYSGDLTPDPGHHFPDVNMQIFSNWEGTNDGGPLMQGFVRSYEKHTHDKDKAHRIMRCFSPDRVPVLCTLARQYAICDRWFSSVPGPTLPNRSYMHSATSIGRVDMSPVWYDESKTIYELLNENGLSGKIFYHDWSIAMTFKMLADGQYKWFGQADDFYRACRKNTLPAYSFIEPRYNDSDEGDQVFAASDQHPDHNVTEGENLIRDVYNAVRSNPDVWKNTVLAIVYDEHGGLYDHVTPPSGPPYAVNPDGKIAQSPGENVAQIPPFDFTRLGVRVPAVIVSAYIEPGTIDSTVYDHTAIIATARKLLLGEGWENKYLTARDRAANTFDRLMTRTEPRDDKVDFKALQNDMPPPVADLARTNCLDKPLTTHQQMLVQHAWDVEQAFPADRRTGKKPADIVTERDASAYLRTVAAELRREKPQVAGGGGS